MGCADSIRTVRHKNDPIALWIVLSCQGAIALGTLLGGWRIVKTMGQKITKLKPFEGFCAESAGCSYTIRSYSFWYSCEHNSCYNRGNYRSRSKKRSICRQMGSDNQDILGMVAYNSGICLVGSFMYYFFNCIFSNKNSICKIN